MGFEAAAMEDFLDPQTWQENVDLLDVDKESFVRKCTNIERIRYLQYILFKSYLNTCWQNFYPYSSHGTLVNECLCHITLWKIFVLSSEENIRKGYKEECPWKYKLLHEKSEMVKL